VALQRYAYSGVSICSWPMGWT